MAPSCKTLAIAALAATAVADLPEPLQQYSWYKNYEAQPDIYRFYSCYEAVQYITFNYPEKTGDYYTDACNNELMVKSMYYCAARYASLKESIKGRKFIDASCVLYGHTSLPSIESNLLSAEDLAKVPVVNYTAALASSTNPLNVSVIPDEAFYGLAFDTVAAFNNSWILDWNFTWGLICFWAFVVLVGMFSRAWEVLKKPSESRQASWWVWFRRNLILPATFSKHQAEAVAYTGTIPPRLESLILTLYVILNFVMMFPGYDLFAGNLYYATNKLQLARYIADRSGFLSIAQFPMIWVFASRNDPFMWLTGWSFATYNRFHRWIARISTVHAIVHSIAYTLWSFYYTGDSSYYNESWKEQYWYMGGLATVVMSLMLGASAYVFRARWYDMFLIIHILASVLFLVAMFYHIKIFSGEFMYFLWVCIAMWSADRLLRIGRTIFVSVMPRFSRGVKATVTYDRSTQMVRMDITDFMPSKPVSPGQFYYLYMPNGLRGYESHPFTLCSWRRTGASTPSSPISRSINEKEVGANVRSLSDDYSTSETAHTLLVRPYKGMTGRMQTKLMSGDTSVTSMQQTIFLEGPYGHEIDLSGYSDIVVISAGSGITAAISHTHFVLSKNKTTRVHIAWAVPQRHLPDDICANELASVINTDRVTMTCYFTDTAEQEVRRASTTGEIKDLPEQVYEVRVGRPDIEAVMREARSKATRNLAVVTCGTPNFADVSRKAVVRLLKDDGCDVGYYDDTMTW